MDFLNASAVPFAVKMKAKQSIPARIRFQTHARMQNWIVIHLMEIMHLMSIRRTTNNQIRAAVQMLTIQIKIRIATDKIRIKEEAATLEDLVADHQL